MVTTNFPSQLKLGLWSLYDLRGDLNADGTLEGEESTSSGSVPVHLTTGTTP